DQVQEPEQLHAGIEALQQTGAPRELLGFERMFENPKEAVNGSLDNAIRAHATHSAAGPQRPNPPPRPPAESSPIQTPRKGNSRTRDCARRAASRRGKGPSRRRTSVPALAVRRRAAPD